MRRRTVLAAVAGAAGLAGCSGGRSTETATPTPTATPACPGRGAYDEPGEVQFEYGVKSRDEKRYDGTLRVVHTQTPPCRFEDTPCGESEREEVVAEKNHRVTGDIDYGIVKVPLTEGVDTVTVEFEAAGSTASKTGIEDAARPLVGPDDGAYDFLVCNGGSRRFGLVVEGGEPAVIRARAPT